MINIQLIVPEGNCGIARISWYGLVIFSHQCCIDPLHFHGAKIAEQPAVVYDDG